MAQGQGSVRRGSRVGSALFFSSLSSWQRRDQESFAATFPPALRSCWDVSFSQVYDILFCRRRVRNLSGMNTTHLRFSSVDDS